MAATSENLDKAGLVELRNQWLADKTIIEDEEISEHGKEELHSEGDASSSE